jgi:hypothetical protein
MRDEGGTIFLSKSNSGQENISLSINAAALNDRSIKEIAESRANSLISRGIKLTKSPELTTVGTKSSYVFVSDEANPVSYIFIPVGPDNYLEVLSSINDPENTGFQSIVESIISSIDFVPTRTS